jgi:hypothetical protein
VVGAPTITIPKQNTQENIMRSIITTLALTTSLLLVGATGCGSDSGSSCDKVADHFVSVAPAELKEQLGDKKALIEQCEKKMSPEERTCALAAKDMESIMKCRKAKG